MTMEATQDPPRPAKLDPETLVLRGAPARVTRFRRGAIIGLAAAGLALIATVAWIALRPASLALVADTEDRNLAAAKSPGDALAGAPSSYGDIPKLGPPLPGDLGRPILKRQDEWTADDPAAAARLAEQEAEAERQRIAAEERAALSSAVMMAGSGTARMAGATAPAAASHLPETAPAPTASAPPAPPDVSAHRLAAPASPWMLQAGSVIAASLITGLNSDLPGLVTAQVTENVYDSVTGRTLLVPQGARLVGRYDSAIAHGQSRALLLWERIILPDGSSLRLDDLPGTDSEGHAGLADRVDRHGGQHLKGVLLSTLLGVGTELGAAKEESEIARAIRESAQQGGARAGDQLALRSLDIPPTLRVRPGWPLRVIVNKDIVLRPWRQGGAR
ncbi:type IV secretion system protein VirB10 [Sphingopyxis sp. YR583]|uniref:TrbI/VirB10 family protein n=1 Tax=Sphingopyxis sp. YR583 TaxID=1881047 RepID=UPI0008A7D80D|nr:TrbI/VirB10 family protein [Sphingopyxis sp. YR583]SEH12562.1 type IV secretion system protein VirB10 [Sphingopyxis sp. YR583]